MKIENLYNDMNILIGFKMGTYYTIFQGWIFMDFLCTIHNNSGMKSTSKVMELQNVFFDNRYIFNL